MRAFLALDVSEPTRERLGDVIRQLSTGTRGVKWVRADQIHLTLKFFHDLGPAEAEAVRRASREIALSTIPFEYDVARMGFFGTPARMRVIWCGLRDAGQALASLHGALEARLAEAGFPPEDRGFRPHLTLGRLRRPGSEPALLDALRHLGGFEAGKERPDHLTLYQSTLTPAGPIHEVVDRWPFEGDR